MKTSSITTVAALMIVFGLTALSQVPASQDLAVNVRFSATRAQTVPGTCCFYLAGGAADAALSVLPHVAAVVEAAGQTASRVAGTSRGLSTITFLAGPRYTQPVGPRFSVAGQALFGAVRGFDADFSTAAGTADTATAFGLALGGYAEYRLSSSLHVRVAQFDYVQTNLPNGADNRQRNIRVGAGITFTVPLPQSRR